MVALSGRTAEGVDRHKKLASLPASCFRAMIPASMTVRNRGFPEDRFWKGSPMPAPATILDLVARFRANLDSYKRGLYNETQVRREFIDPFFDALGWDVANRQGYAEAYKDVVHEEAIKVGGGTKAPDYGFRIGGTRKFFVEAKKPSVDIKGDVHPAYQLRRYAWSAKLPLSILTDFEEFAVYDCRVKPDKGDKPSAARVMYLTFDQYADRWDEIAGIFARDAILKGSFDKYAEAKGGKRGTAEVDAAFLAEIERWRDLLAHNIALRNAALSQRELNFAVQQTIDRIIFLRICEDRGIEPYGTLLGLVNGAEVYGRLLLRFRHADDALQLRPVPLRGRPEGGPRRCAGHADAAAGDRRQGPGRHPQEPLLPRQPLRVLRAAGRHPGPGLRAVPGQGNPSHSRAPRRGGGEAGGQEGRRGLLHAHLHRGYHRASDPGQAAGGPHAAPGRGPGPPRWAQGDPRAGGGHRLRLRLLPAGRVPVPAGLVPGRLPGRRRRRGREVGHGPQPAALSERSRRVAADHRRAQADPAGPHLRRGHRPAGRGGDQAVAPAQGAGGGETSRPSASSLPCSPSARCPTWAATSSAATRSSGRTSTPTSASRWRC